jgi:hypothetical protein
MKKLFIAVLLFGGFVSAQGPKSTGKITFDEKAELIKKMQMDYAANEFGLFESLMVDTVAVYLGSTKKATKEELIQGFKSHHQLYKDINWGWINTETALYDDGSQWTMVWALWKAEGNFTGTKSEVPGHFAYQWKDGKIVTAMYYFDPTSLMAEVSAMNTQAVDYGYKATYSSNWKIGNPENVKIVLDIQKAAEGNDFDAVKALIHPEIYVSAGDGSEIKGVEDFTAMFEPYLKNNLFSIKPAVWISVVNETGDEWVLLWSEEETTAKDGTKTGIEAQESFRIIDGKIGVVNQFQKSLPK